MKNKYHIITLGCAMNHSDSNRIASFLDKHKYVHTAQIEEANLLLINTCGIRQSAENRAYSLVNNARKLNKNIKIVLTGCLSRREDVKRRLAAKVDLFMPISALPDIVNLLNNPQAESVLSLDEVRLMQGEKYLTILPKQSNAFAAFVPIGNGCNNFCSYCVVPYARGREVYRSAQDIIAEVKSLVDRGYREITLIAQNVNSYHSQNYDFPKLLAKVAELKGDFWLRFSSSHPKDVSDRLIAVIGRYDKICSHLHLALQSGDDDILEAMNRKYSAKHFLGLIKKVRAVKKDVSISSDIIVGYPGESEANFLNTVKVFKKAKFDMAYISRYSPRPGTVSAKLKDDVSPSEKARREKVLEELMFASNYKTNKGLKGTEVLILLEGKNRKGKYYGRTSNNKMVQISSSAVINKKNIGSFLRAKIISAGIMGLEAEFIAYKE